MNSKTLLIASIYATNADSRRDVFLSELTHLFEELKVMNDNKYFIMAGDLNARHPCYGDRISNDRGRHLRTWELAKSNRYKLTIIPPVDYTFISSQSFLDLAFVDSRLNIDNLINSRILTYIYDSDHKAIAMKLDLDYQMGINLAETIHDGYFVYKSTDWEKFTKNLNDDYILEIPNNRNLD